MTGMWPNPVPEQQQQQHHHMQHGQHVPVSYGSGYQQPAPLDVYGSAGMVPGWTAAQPQYSTGISHHHPQQQQQQHMYQTVHMAGGGHAMWPQHMRSMGHYAHHGGMQHQAGGHGRAAAGAGVMPQQWFGASGQHVQQPAMVVQGSPPPGSRGGWSPGGPKAGAPFGAGGFSNNRPFYGGGGGRQQQGGRGGGGGRARRHIVLNTDPGDFSDAAVEEFAAAVKRTPGGEPLDAAMLSNGLTNLDSRGLAALLKELAKGHHGRRAREVFDFLRSLPPTHPLASLCDVFTYTAMVSLCVDNQELSRAFDLVGEMRQRSVECNVHTYTALMNVAIKSGQLQRALEVYHDMLREGCTPNVVTYNTLIDVYGKTGQWGEALNVIHTMNSSNTKPVTRTYNTLMIACNTSGQWQEALSVYGDMLRRGHQPNTTTYNALISAYSKAGRLEKVMETYQEMQRTGCERSVITYSALISACEKAGQWQLALNLFNEMLRERCTPNVITYNSLITACAQGAQWSKAAEVFQQMQANNCKPDVVTYTALVTAYERGGQWMKALEAFRQMHQQAGCTADAILYNTLLDVLWDTGIPWAQHQAAQLFRTAVDEGHFRKLPLPSAQGAASSDAASTAGESACGTSDSPTSAAAAATGGTTKLELGMQGVSPGVAMLMLHCWLADLRALAVQQPSGVPERVLVSAGRNRQRDHISGLLRDSTLALLTSWNSPFVVSASGADGVNSSSSLQSSNSKLEASSARLAEWLRQEHMTKLLAGFARQPGVHNKGSGGDGSAAVADMADEADLEQRCHTAFAAVKDFETSHCLSVQAMGAAYTSARAGLVVRVLAAGEALSLRNDVVHDAVLLMDRAMSAAFKVEAAAYSCLAAACLHHVVGSTADLPAPPSLAATCDELGWGTPDDAQAMLQELKTTLQDDLSSISALRCLKLYLERLGSVFGTDGSCDSVDNIQDSLDLVARAASDNEFLNYRPTITAAAVLYCERLHKGKLPFWPSSLCGLTSYSNARTPELSAAISAAQRLWRQLAGPSQQPAQAAGAAPGSAPAAAPAAADGGGASAAAVAAAAQPAEAQQAPPSSNGTGGMPAAPAAEAPSGDAGKDATEVVDATGVDATVTEQLAAATV